MVGSCHGNASVVIQYLIYLSKCENSELRRVTVVAPRDPGGNISRNRRAPSRARCEKTSCMWRDYILWYGSTKRSVNRMSLKELVVTREAIAEEVLCGSLKGLVCVLD